MRRQIIADEVPL